MKLYLANGLYVGTQAEAKKLDRDFTQVEVPTDKEGLINYLNANFAHADVDFDEVYADKPVKDVNEDLHPERAPRAAEPAYTAQTLDLDEQWESLPLARKLHFAALAVEDARTLVPKVVQTLDRAQDVVDPLS